MKKISSIEELHAEKKRLKDLRKGLEQDMSTDWRDLKSTAKPGPVVKEVFSNALSLAPSMLLGGGISKAVMNVGLGFLTRKITDKGLQGLGRFFKKRSNSKE